MEYTFGDMVKDGPMCLGMHKKRNFMSIITVDQCQLVDEEILTGSSGLRWTLPRSGVTKYYHKEEPSRLAAPFDRPQRHADR